MTQQNEEEEFFTAGLVHYGTAVKTAEDFRRIVPPRLVAMIGAHEFKHWERNKAWKEEYTHYPKQATRDTFISVGVQGRYGKDEAQLELGLWWFAAGFDCAVYAGFHSKSSWSTKVRPTTSDVKYYSGSTSYLLLPLPKNAPLAPVAASILATIEMAAEIARSP